MGLFIFFVMMVSAIILFIADHCKRKTHLEAFPPISDEEFLAMCPPPTNPAVALKVRRILSDQLGVEYERIYPSSRILPDLIAD